jgi:hypothetical protein
MKGLVQDATGNDLTYRIIGEAMTVHNSVGAGYNQRQFPVEVHHAETQVAVFYLDLWIEEQVVVEVKAFSHQLTNDERAQLINYLKATGAPVGLLINFGRRKLEFKRIFPGPKINQAIQRHGRDDVIKTNLPDIE